MKRAATGKGDGFGAAMGFLTFLGGIALLALTFKIAYELFSIPPENALGMTGNQNVDLAKTGTSFGWILARVVLLLVMAGVGSAIANRGIKLYVSARSITLPPSDAMPPEKVESETARVI